MAKKAKAKPVQLPYSLFISEYDESYICLNHVVMTRWDGGPTLGWELMVFFATGPHIKLEEKIGEKFLKALERYHRLEGSTKMSMG